MAKPRRRANVPSCMPSYEELLGIIEIHVGCDEKLWKENKELRKAIAKQQKTIDEQAEKARELRRQLREAQREHANGNGKARGREHSIDGLDRELPLFALGSGTPGARGT